MQAAPIPKGYAFTYEQFVTFESPEHYNQHFFRGAVIPLDYASRINVLLRSIDEVCRFKSKANDPDITEWESINEASDVIYLELNASSQDIIVKIIGIRPCFAGHHMFMILVYALMRLACITDKRLAFATCYPTTHRALTRHFDDVIDREESFDTTIVFSNHKLLAYITPEYFLIAHLIFENSKGALQIKTAQFPASRLLNDQGYVDDHYQKAILTPKE